MNVVFYGLVLVACLSAVIFGTPGEVGKAAMDNPDLPVGFIHELLVARAEGIENATPFVPEGVRD